MASEIDELKEMVRHQNDVIEDTNRQLHKMRRSARWSRLFSIAWWLIVAGASGAVYYYYLQPYIQSLMTAYQNVQHGAQQAQSFQQMITSSIQKFFEQFSATSTKQ